MAACVVLIIFSLTIQLYVVRFRTRQAANVMRNALQLDCIDRYFAKIEPQKSSDHGPNFSPEGRGTSGGGQVFALRREAPHA